jgi:biopolymer transport protein TolR
MAERRSRRRLMNEINVVPYIDVMLVLLVIFMITAPLITPGQIELPQVGKSLAPPVAPLEVVIKADGTLRLHDRSGTGGEQKAEQSVVIAADKDVRYEEVINVMDVLQQQQVKKVGLLARPK